MVNKSELLFVVDEFDVPIEPKPRHETLANGYWHRTAHVWIINNKKQLLCQKRSLLKDMSPGMWEPFISGHIGPGDDYFTGAVKEVREETGIPIVREDLQLVKIYKDYEFNEFRGIFFCRWNGRLDEIVSEADEVDEVRWVPLDLIQQYLVEQTDKWLHMPYDSEMLSILQG